MGWTHIQDTALATLSSGTSLSTAAFSSANTLGNFIIFYAWGTKSSVSSDLTVTDNAATPNTYNLLGFAFSSTQSPTIWCAIYIAQINSLPNSGNLAVTINEGQTAMIMCCASEWNGGSRGTTVAEISVSQKDLTGNPFAGNMTTLSLDALIVAACISQDPSNPGTITVPNHFTSVQSQLDGVNLKMCNACYFITSGTNITQSNAWTFDSGAFANSYAAQQISLGLTPLRAPPTGIGLGNAEGSGA